ncbi:MAG: L,D-transpeptidase family protein [Rubrivivax sp.]|nr:L,D-transpeptidase family protein [Rubrivivax sp.]
MRLMHTITAYARTAALGIGLACSCAAAADDPLWFEAGRPGDQAHQAVQLLGAAASHGLEPRDYNADALRQAVAAAATRSAPLEAARVMRLDQALTDAMQRYLGDLHSGRVDPRQIHHNFRPARRDAFDARSALHAALAASRLPEAAAEAAPGLPLYGRLREVLARYRAMDDAAWHEPLPSLPGGSPSRVGKLDPGQAYAGLAPLAQRLLALGDLAPDAGPAMPLLRYEGVLVDAIKAFQQRHGLVVDGVVGSATMAQLKVTPAARVRQIELTLERLRWTPLMQGPRMIVVNIPEFVLRAYEVRDGRIAVIQEMKVIVGKALDTRTPLFDEDMRFIEFSPYWNVPRSIARNEIVPRLRRDPGYFTREDFEFVARDGRVQSELSPADLDAVLAGELRIRQRPGPRNALGDIKFVFPNHDAIFLHHTPATALFARDRRDFSHGCIRVEEPVALATFVLGAMPDWPEDRIRQAMGTGRSQTLRLAEPVPVLIAYGTVLFKSGRVHFFDDLYGMDRVLDMALRRRLPIARQSLE